VVAGAGAFATAGSAACRGRVTAKSAQARTTTRLRDFLRDFMLYPPSPVEEPNEPDATPGKTIAKLVLGFPAYTMASLTFFSWSRLAVAGMLVSGVARAEPANTSTVSVNVGPLRAVKGSLACRLYTTSNGFPRTATGTLNRRAKIAGDHARCVFEKVAPGTYAVMVHHDENDNGKMDKNLLGMPLEGYGASNNRTHALSAPSWDESKFAVEAGKPRTLSITLRY
jgi:uncharacterized protein (DUF2141 family)